VRDRAVVPGPRPDAISGGKGWDFMHCLVESKNTKEIAFMHVIGVLRTQLTLGGEMYMDNHVTYP
jgi:hypothetical protein